MTEARDSGERMAAGEEAYRELIAPIEGRMMRIVARIVRDPDDAADALQDALMRIWRDLQKIEQHPNPHGYILRVCVSASYDAIRKRKRREARETVLENEQPSPEKLEASLTARETERVVLTAIASLPRQQAEAVLMRVLLDESFEAIAQVLGCSEATARSHVSKGKARLRSLLQGLNPQKKAEGEI